MTLMRTRIIVSAAVFAANLVLSLSYGTAEAQASRHGADQISRLHHGGHAEPSMFSAETRSTTMQPEITDKTYADYSGFCGFSGVNAC
jgi:hypothetical protein